MMSIGRMHKLKRMLSYAEQISSFENGESRHKLKQRMIVKEKKVSSLFHTSVLVSLRINKIYIEDLSSQQLKVLIL